MQCTLDWLSIIDLLPKTYLINEEIIHGNKSIIRSPLFNFPRRTSRGNKSVIVHNEVHPAEEVLSNEALKTLRLSTRFTTRIPEMR